MASDPDLAGFVDAQRRLRDKLGRTVTFFTPVAPTYDAALPSAAFDPETGFPYDPAIQPVASGYASAAVKGSRIFKPVAMLRGEEQNDALGQESRLSQQVIVDITERSLVADAEFYELDGEKWTIDDVVTDGIGGEQRVIVYSKRGVQ